MDRTANFYFITAFRNKGLVTLLPNILTASSEQNTFPASQALLDSSGGGWRPGSNDQRPWIQVRLLAVNDVIGIHSLFHLVFM